MKREFIVERQGRSFILYAGLLDLAHQQGLKSIRTELIQVPAESNNRVAICAATVTMERDGQERVFTGIGDAAMNNVAPAMQTCLIRMAECVPLSARILTRDGWKGYDQVQIGEDILAYDVETDTCRWTPLRHVSVYEDDYVTVNLRSRSFAVTCTPNHTWAVAPQNMKRRLREARRLTKADRIVVAAPAEGGDSPLTAREAAILGWIATDGTVRYMTSNVNGKQYLRVSIAQSKPEMIAKLRTLLGEDATIQFCKGEHHHTFPTGKTYACLPAYKFELNAEFARQLLAKANFTHFADLPLLVSRLSREARAAMLEAMLDGDGATGSYSATRIFAQKAKPGVMEMFELLATLEGRALGIPRLLRRYNMPCRSLRVNRYISASYLQIEPGDPQPVWCPTTDYGTWVMNLNGSITITGNTRAKARALRDAVNIGVAAFEELGEEGAHDGAPERGYAISPARSTRIERTADATRPAPSRAPAPKPAVTPPAEGVSIPAEMRNPAANPITEAQMEAIRSLCRRRGLEPDTLAQEKFEAENLNALTQAQGSDLIKTLNERNNGRPAMTTASA